MYLAQSKPKCLGNNNPQLGFWFKYMMTLQAIWQCNWVWFWRNWLNCCVHSKGYVWPLLLKYNNMPISILYEVKSLRDLLPPWYNFVEGFKGLLVGFYASRHVILNKSMQCFLCEIIIPSFECFFLRLEKF